MLRRMYVDNFKCFLNFECKFDNINLILGTNGSGKSSVFDVLRNLQEVVTGRSPIKLFQESTLTRWQQRDVQVFELEVEGNGGIYTYRLEIEHEIGEDKRRIRLERVTFDGKFLYSAELDDLRLTVHLYKDDTRAGPTFGGDWSQSGLAFLGDLPENTKITWLKKWFRENLFCLQIDPLHIKAMADITELNLDTCALNYVGWYRHRISSDMNATVRLRDLLQDMYDDFGGLTLDQQGTNVVHLMANLGVREETKGKPVFVRYSFGELSDGERTLIVLYTLLQLMSDSDTTLCLDEPDNYLALAEIQPWLLNLRDRIDSSGSQAVLISHHPELINNLAVGCGLVFERDKNGPVRVKPFPVDTGQECLTPSEVVARGLE